MKAAHLKPVDRTPPGASVPASYPWSKATNGGQPSWEGEESGGSLVTDTPTNQQEFLRAWRGCPDDGTKRYGLLLRLATKGLEQVFPVGSSVQLLGDILVALNEVCCTCCSTLSSTSSFWLVSLLPCVCMCRGSLAR